MTKNLDKRLLPQQHKRSHYNNYHGRGIYMLTLCTDGRLPLLGTLIGNSSETATINPSPLGLQVLKCWNNIPAIQKELAQKKMERTGELCLRDISLIACQLMPDHFHGIIFVREEMDIAVGDVVRGFMVGCSKAYNEQNASETKIPLWEKGFHDRILLHAGQLKHMINYLHDNPRRLWLKKQNPNLFTIHRQTEIRGLKFTSLGNHFMLDWPDRQLLEMSRSATEEQIQRKLQFTLNAAHNGAVTYTAAISKGEQFIARTLREQGFPLVVILSEGFPSEGSPHEKFYKPCGVYFEACTKGKLLLLEPTEQVFNVPHIHSATEETLRHKAEAKHISFTYIPTTSKRYRFVALNEIGRWLIDGQIESAGIAEQY